jgi:hypothetical protein
MPRKPLAKLYTDQLKRLDRVAGDLNVVLVMLAIGLTTLDLTFVASQKLLDHLPELTGAPLLDGSDIISNTARTGPTPDDRSPALKLAPIRRGR